LKCDEIAAFEIFKRPFEPLGGLYRGNPMERDMTRAVQLLSGFPRGRLVVPLSTFGCAASPAGSLLLSVWINDITQAWLRGTAHTLDLALLVSKARNRLWYGEWSQLWRSGQLPFSKRKGAMLVVIGAALGTLLAQNSAQLPSAWNTLYCVARLGRPAAEQLIRQGRIHPGLTLQEARALLHEYQPGAARRSSRSTVKQRVASFTAFVRATAKKWSQEERQFACAGLIRLVEELRAGPSNSSGHDSPSELPKNGAACLNTTSLTVRPRSVIPNRN